MKRFHIHFSVKDLDKNIEFYSQLFNRQPAVSKDDYAKWSLDDPALNFAISTRGTKIGLDHVGIQTDTDEELTKLRNHIENTNIKGVAEDNATCCYAKGDKYWVQDPQGIAWEAFHSLETVPVFGEEFTVPLDGACCAPDLPGSKSSCCS